MIGQTLRQVMPLEVWRRLEPLCLQALAGETTTFQQASLDGKAVYESTFSPVVRDGSIAGATMTSRDITAQKSAEAELANASGRLQAILDHSPMAIYMRDTDQRWIVANPETCASRQVARAVARQPAVGDRSAGDLRAARGPRPPGAAAAATT